MIPLPKLKIFYSFEPVVTAYSITSVLSMDRVFSVMTRKKVLTTNQPQEVRPERLAPDRSTRDEHLFFILFSGNYFPMYLASM